MKQKTQEIFETVIYCGRLKRWRILNITTGTIYSGEFKTEDDAYAGIEDGAERAGAVVKRIKREEIVMALDLYLYQ